MHALLLCVGLSEAIKSNSRKHFLPASHVSSSLGFTAEAESGVGADPRYIVLSNKRRREQMPSYPLKLPYPSKEGFRGQAQSRRGWWAGVSGCVANKNDGCDYDKIPRTPPSPHRTVVLPFAIPHKLSSLRPSPFSLTVHIDHDFNYGYQPHPYPPRASFRTLRTRGQWRHSDEEFWDDLHRWTSVSRKYLTTLKTGSDC